MKRLILLSLLVLFSCSKDSSEPEIIVNVTNKQYTLSVDADQGGTVSTNGGVFTEGTLVNIQASPNSGYTFSGWSNGSTTNPLSITMSSNTSITANFALIPVYTITVSAEDGGSVSSEGGEYQQGTLLTLIATPDEGYEFSGWSDGSTEATRVITASENLTLTASFSELIINYTLTVTSGEGGSVNSEGGEYEEGTEVTLTASATEGYRFIGWSDDTTEESITITLNSDTAITASFELIPDYTLTVTGQGGVVSGAGEYQEGTEVTLTATPNEGYEFSSWSDGNTDQSRTITITQDTTLTANFSENTQSTGGGSSGSTTTETTSSETSTSETTSSETSTSETTSSETSASETVTQYTLSVTLNPSIAGLVNPQSGTYNEGENVTIQISPNTDYTFTGWTGSWNSTDQQITLSMDSDKNLTANFSFLDDDNDGVGNSVDSCSGTSNGSAVDSEGCTISILYQDSNGITIKANSDAQVGQTSTFNGQSYIVVDRALLESKINAGENVENVVTTLVVNMSSLFLNKTSFNQDISSWDVSNVTQFQSMFQGATSFNQDISSWDVSNANNMQYMFASSGFNRDISSWDVTFSKQIEMMFHGNPNYNQSGTYWGNVAGSPIKWNRLVVNTDVLSATSGGYVSLNSTSGGYVSTSGVGNYTDALSPYTGGTYIQGIGNPYMTANPNTGYSFVKWTASNPPISSIRGVESNDINVGTELTADQTLTANFLINTHTLTASSSNGGSVFVNGVFSLNANSTFNYGQQVNLSVEPIPYFRFVNWSGASTSTSPEITLTMDSDKTITGNFDYIIDTSGTVYYVTVTSTAGGEVNWVFRTGGSSQGESSTLTLPNAGSDWAKFYTDDEITLTATPNSGNSFVEWECTEGCSGNTFGTNEVLNLTIIDSNISVTAKFQ